MADLRWAPSTRDLVAAVITAARGCNHAGAESCKPWWHADAALTALADAGLLLPPDVEANRQYGRLMPGGRVIPSATPDPTHYRLVGPWRAVDS